MHKQAWCLVFKKKQRALEHALYRSINIIITFESLKVGLQKIKSGYGYCLTKPIIYWVAFFDALRK